MKTLNVFAFAFLCICLIFACDVSEVDDEFQEENSSLENLAPGNRGNNHINGKLPIERHKLVVAFEAKFFTNTTGQVVDPRCNDPRVLDTQVGEGHAENIGDFSIHFNFCIDPTDVVDDGQLTDNEALPYYKGIGTFTFSNGDKLFGEIRGAVLPTDKPGYDFEFMDPMVFTGGTGRFEGATGGGLTNSFVAFGAGTDHEFSAVLVLPKHRGHDRDNDDDWDDDDDWRDNDDDDD
ncbi:hypothetical protein NC796_17155 [Aliifodinibius sp. S!AR15-10]|uniref:hypothetical protein n=1 Tax=Aliifodinibius sp. S!AR15-10 TaxID=2950437 RepID=UPI00285C1EB9|nr:hypothetical protein [Aliifodinibius sp. S!AR15-10]MDR8392887.1 hypothetical protein [Aliifodinibius sp. S!AR15-10]